MSILHLGDRNEVVPNAHGFDEWHDNLYHFHAEEEPEQLDYPVQYNPGYKENYGIPDEPWFVWFNSTAIHIWSHPTRKYVKMAVDEGRAVDDVVGARMIEHDEQVGALPRKFDDPGTASNTILKAIDPALLSS